MNFMVKRYEGILSIAILIVFLFSSGFAEEKADFFKGYSLMQQGKYEEALKQFEQVMAAGGSNKVPACSNIALCYERLKMYKQAIETWEEYLIFKPTSADKVNTHIKNLENLIRTEALITEGKVSTAIELFEQISRDDYTGSPIRQLALDNLQDHYQQILDKFDLKSGKHNLTDTELIELIPVMEKIISLYTGDKNAARVYQGLIEAYDKKGDFQSRDNAFLKYISGYKDYYDPEETALEAERIAKFYFDKRDYDKCRQFLKIILDKFGEVKTIDISKIHQMLAQSYRQIGYYTEALAEYNALLNSSDENSRPGLLVQIADTHIESGHPELAIQNYYQAADIYRRIEKYDRAIEIYQKIIAKFPNSIEQVSQARLMCGINYMEKPDDENALREFVQIVKSYPASQIACHAQFLIAYIYLSNQQYPEARQEFYRLVQLFTNEPYVKEAKSMIERLNEIITNSNTTAKVTSSPGKNIVLITLDTLRADHLGCYGYNRQTSPNIDNFSREAVLFTQAISPASWTTPAHMSIFTGVYPPLHGVTDTTKTLIPGRKTLAQILKDAGYNTAAFISAPPMMPVQAGFGNGFYLFDNWTVEFDIELDLFGLNTEHKGQNDHPISPVTEFMVKRWLEANSNKNKFFIFAHYWDIHGDYSPPAPYDKLFDKDYIGEFDGSNSKINEIKPGIDENDLAHMVALYDGEIRYVDDYIKKLFDRIYNLHLMDKTMVIMTADHGEEFLEHGGNWHGHTLYEELIHVPLIVYIPGTEGGKVINKQVSTLDIMPTILEFLNMPSKGNLGGVSLIDSTHQYQEHVFSHTDAGGIGLAAIRTEKLKYIHSSKENKYQMYDLTQDPKEHNNISGYGQLQEDQLKVRLFGWLEDCKKIISAQIKDSDSEQTMGQELKEKLKSLGYLH